MLIQKLFQHKNPIHLSFCEIFRCINIHNDNRFLHFNICVCESKVRVNCTFTFNCLNQLLMRKLS